MGIGGRAGGGAGPRPPRLRAFWGTSSFLPGRVLSPSPHNRQPQLRPRRACGPLNEGRPLLVIKMSEEALKREPLGPGPGRPRAALPGARTGHSSGLWKAAREGARPALRALTRSLGTDGGVGRSHRAAARTEGPAAGGRGGEAGSQQAPAARALTPDPRDLPRGPAGGSLPAQTQKAEGGEAPRALQSRVQVTGHRTRSRHRPSGRPPQPLPRARRPVPGTGSACGHPGLFWVA